MTTVEVPYSIAAALPSLSVMDITNDVSREVAEFIDGLGITVYEGYGLTETSPISTTNWPNNRRIGSVGKAIPGVRIEIDPTNGGGEKNIDPGFKVMKEDVNPNVLAYEPSPGKMTELFQSGQAAIAPRAVAAISQSVSGLCMLIEWCLRGLRNVALPKSRRRGAQCGVAR